MNTKSKLSMVLTALILVGWTLYSVFSGIIGLSKSGYFKPSANAEVGDLCETDIMVATEVFEVKHTLNILIPTGKEHFYLCLSEEGGIPLLIKAKPSWYKANFDSNGIAHGMVTIKGEVKRMDYKFHNDIEEMNSDMTKMGMEFSVSTTKYLASNYKTEYVLRLASGIYAIAAGAAMLIIFARGEKHVLAAVLGFSALLFMVFVLLCGGTV